MSTLPNKYLRSAYDRITGLNTRFRITTEETLWRMVPRQVAYKFIPKSYHPKMRALLKAGKSCHSLEYRRDYSLKRVWRVWKNHVGNMVRFNRHNKVPQENR